MKAGNKKKSFDAPRTSTFVYAPEDVVIVGHDTKDGPGHPLYAPDCNDPIDPVFQENIFQHGVDTDVTITKWEGRPCVVIGRTRVRAARIANIRRKKEGLPLIRIGCKVVAGVELKLARRKIRENHLRKTIGVLQKAEDAQYLIDQGLPIEEAAVELGVKPQTIKEWQVILGATADVRKAVAAGKIGATAAARIAKLEGGDAQKKALAEVLTSGVGSTVAARRAVAKGRGKSGDGVGISRTDQRKLLEVVKAAVGGDAPGVSNDDEAYDLGFYDALRVILGEGTSARAGELLDKIGDA